MEVLEHQFVLARRPASPREFIEFWAATYHDQNEGLYTQNINGPHTVESLLKLFHWKMGNVFFNTGQLRRSVNTNFVSRIESARELAPDIPAKEFLGRFPDGGPIHRIFWLHCWHPDRFPIYDQHVRRAMIFIREGRIESRYQEAQKAINSYLEQYLPFYKPFAEASASLPFDRQVDGVSGRKADRALWEFGKFLLTDLAGSISS